LKMENIMFASKDSDTIRLIDFGLSKKFLSREDIFANEKLLSQTDQNRILKTACGTAFYMAPEMLTMSYSEKADVWALGVITFMLITGKPPFEGKDENTVFERVRRGRVFYNEKIWGRLSPEVLEFTKALLMYDPEKRPSAKETLELSWLAKYQKRRRQIMEGKDGKVLGKEVCDSLMRFASYPPLKRAALMVVSHHLKEQDTRELGNMFLTLDEDHSGELTFEEMYGMIQKFAGASVTEEYFRQVFEQLDQEKTGKVHYMEFLAATVETRVKLSGNLLNQAFDHLDVESSGIISVDNMKQLLGRNFTRSDVESLMKQGLHHFHSCSDGPENDACVTRSDFIQMMGDAEIPSPSQTPVPETPSPTELSPSPTPPPVLQQAPASVITPEVTIQPVLQLPKMVKTLPALEEEDDFSSPSTPLPATPLPNGSHIKPVSQVIEEANNAMRAMKNSQSEKAESEDSTIQKPTNGLRGNPEPRNLKEAFAAKSSKLGNMTFVPIPSNMKNVIPVEPPHLSSESALSTDEVHAESKHVDN